MENARRSGHEHGTVVFAYSATVGFLVLGTTLAASALAEHRLSLRTLSELQAFYAAEAGLDQALVALRGDPGYPGAAYTPLYDASGNEIGGYSLTVVDVGNDQRAITVVGHYPSGDPNIPWYASATVMGRARLASSLFTGAVFANQTVRITGNGTVDSYDSRDGPYCAAAAGSNGDVGTNGTANGAVTLTGNATVRGDAWVGPGADPNAAVTLTGNASITGQKLAMSAPRVLAPVTIPDGLGCGGNLSVCGNTTLTLPGGTYRYHNVSVSGNGRINFTGPATLYVSGTVSISGNGVTTAANSPPNLVIYVAGSGSVSVSGNGNFYGAVYAPQSMVSTTGNGARFGALIGNTVRITGNGGVHYDEALGASASGATVTLDLWSRP